LIQSGASPGEIRGLIRGLHCGGDYTWRGGGTGPLPIFPTVFGTIRKVGDGLFARFVSGFPHCRLAHRLEVSWLGPISPKGSLGRIVFFIRRNFPGKTSRCGGTGAAQRTRPTPVDGYGTRCISCALMNGGPQRGRSEAGELGFATGSPRDLLHDFETFLGYRRRGPRRFPFDTAKEGRLEKGAPNWHWITRAKGTGARDWGKGG